MPYATICRLIKSGSPTVWTPCQSCFVSSSVIKLGVCSNVSVRQDSNAGAEDSLTHLMSSAFSLSPFGSEQDRRLRTALRNTSIRAAVVGKRVSGGATPTSSASILALRASIARRRRKDESSTLVVVSSISDVCRREAGRNRVRRGWVM